ncbi:MAG: S-methyl-5'-thioadenosine phosphorylase [Myxococcales bacterium]|nr:S-methyl-5'-thioadenosine phosphorylase [Myxococcales bacterium]MCB9532614.1 S-methyl-5'-thioadenosine phosphorylase [Myxococcales bacterium]MCB9534569.1 S-methyl-5'-thioadenosine phosphorylase [Myxococcales bacterium]
MDDIKIGIIGGSGLYDIDGIEVLDELDIDTPFGKPSDKILVGSLNGRRVAFLPRHGRGHVHNPTQVPVRANIWALKSLGVFWLTTVSAVGSLREEIAPRHFVIPDQIIDRTRARENTFFDRMAVHVGFSHPFDPTLRKILLAACNAEGVTVHDGGTYVCMEGPLFSTKAESEMHRSWGASLIGMTALPEAKLAREAEMSYASICLATDYDVWRDAEEVDVSEVMANVAANVKNVKNVLRRVIAEVPLGQEATSSAYSALQHAIMTKPDQISDEAWREVGLLIGKYYGR